MAAADTREETKALITEAIEFHLEGICEDNEPIPEPGTWTDIIEVKLPDRGGVKRA